LNAKEASDFYSYIGKERDSKAKRDAGLICTEQKLEDMRPFFFKALVVHESEDQLLQPWQYFTEVKPSVVWGFLCAARVKYGLHVYCNAHKERLEMWVLSHLLYCYKS